MKVFGLLIAFVGSLPATADSFAPRRSHGLTSVPRGGDYSHKMTKEIEPVYAAKTISSFDKYKKEHAESIKNPARYWGKLAKEVLDWDVPFDSDRILQGDLTNGDVRWFAGGKLNVAYNALDRHDPEKLAMIWEGDEPDAVRKITFGEMTNKVSQIANALKAKGVQKGQG
jgi:acetyl-CoA synthetase